MPQPRSRHPALVALAVPALLAVLLAIPLFALAGQASTAQASAQRPPAANTLCPAGSQLRSSLLGPPSQFAHIIHVPVDKPTIQGAVDAAQPGDLILVAPGTYHEAVKVCTSDLTIRGEDRANRAQSRSSFICMTDEAVQSMTAS